MVYVLLDDTYHSLLEDGNHTACGLDVPYGSDYIPNGHPKPEGKFCGDCFPDEKKTSKKAK